TAPNARAAATGGAAFVVVTANPGRGATVADLAAAVETVRGAAPDLLCLAGKMHHAGAEEPVGVEVAEALLEADAHGVLVPLPGTVPGVSEEAARAVTARVRAAGGLAVGAVGTSQEGADVTTIRQLAVTAKRVGVDVHHLGDAGLAGVAAPENLYAYGVAVRGVRHTWNRMARGVRGSWRG
ncbi:MAG: haloacid dehalogenase-like hydrolase, partial [Actinomycetota bacterium]|nr:haloacid dehalogenase-like hydrolase [Actinomycetota bacterium]